jgi:hypothetical protein
MSENKVAVLPATVRKLRSLEEFKVESNPLVEPPCVAWELWLASHTSAACCVLRVCVCACVLCAVCCVRFVRTFGQSFVHPSG